MIIDFGLVKLIGLFKVYLIMKSEEQAIKNSSWISLADNENVLAWTHPSVFPYVPSFIIGLVFVISGALGPFIIEGQYSLLPLIVIPIGIMIFVLEYIKYITKFYIFTDRRVITKRGIISHSVRKVRYENIDKKRKNFPLIGRILGFGQLKLVTATPDNSDIDMTYLPAMKEAAELIANNRGNDDNAGNVELQEDRELGEDNF